IKFDNGSEQPIDLDDFSVLAEGATKGGEAAVTTWEYGSAEITGRLAAGQTAAKTEDGVLEKKYGTSMLVTLQRTTDD
ncbi:hypothetical protein KBZ21_43790, partial [Streptomyces sp. A73]|nr:hypothetical protein [Streptomyces sp. A73]